MENLQWLGQIKEHELPRAKFGFNPKTTIGSGTFFTRGAASAHCYLRPANHKFASAKSSVRLLKAFAKSARSQPRFSGSIKRPRPKVDEKLTYCRQFLF
jgi:hypothetical protein